jgi:hypothetical protein
MKLEQGQVWKQGEEFFRIVKWSRTEIVYKVMTDLVEKKGTVHEASKKEFCRLIKGATLMGPQQAPPEGA